MITKHLPTLLPAWAYILALPVFGQPPCAQLSIEHLQYDAFDPSAVELVVNNQSNELFSYPGFVLVDDQGDTLAREQVSFFGIGTGPQAHYLSANPDVTIPTSVFDATLVLLGNFGDTLYCTWDLEDITLCPPDSCIQAEIYLTNTGPLVEFNAFWWMYDTNDGTQVANGFLNMDDVNATHFDTICVPPGAYTLEFSGFSPIDETYISGITPNYQFTLGTNTALRQDSTPLDLSFTWYTVCVDGTNGITTPMERELTIDQLGSHLRITDAMGAALGDISLWSTDGRLVGQWTTNTASIDIPLHHLASGIRVVRVGTGEGHSFTERIFTP
jgi:hypothetical protein